VNSASTSRPAAAGRVAGGALAALTLAFACSTAVDAATAPATRTVIVGPQYAAGGLHSVMLGSSYRRLWTTPITAEVLDLASEAGGLTPTRRVGGQQTKGLALRGSDGRSYTFRSIDKDPSNILPEDLQETFVEELVQDQMAAQHPAGALVVDELARASLIPTLPIRVVVMPDDPVLGEFREDFANVVGTLSEYPTAAEAGHPGFEGAAEIIDHMEMFGRLAASPDDRAAVREYLRARLFDVFVSDFDRHRKQWRWARRPGDPLWHPIPEDRDQAFARYEGLLVRTAAGFVPQIRTFGPKYDKMLGLTYNGREQDRWLLPELSHDAWRESAEGLKSRLTDEVIERAARRMPPEWYAIDGERLAGALKKRRDTLVEEADRYYRHLATHVDVQATDAPEVARVRRLEGGDVEVEIARVGAAGQPEAPYFHRRFSPGETREVRLYLRGGDDRVVTEGRGGPIRVRAIGGGGADVVDDSKGGGTHLYDSEGANRVIEGPGTAWDRRAYVAPPGPKAAPWIPPRDWGRDWYPVPWVSYGSDIGVFVGGGFSTVGYGFRQQPYASRHTLRAGWAFGASQPRAEYEGQFHKANSGVRTGVLARFSGLEVLRYYGFGNETPVASDGDFNKVRQKQLVLAPSLTLPVAGPLDLTLAPVLRYARTEEGSRLVDLDQPYGTGNFGEVGGWVRLQLDNRVAYQEGMATRTGMPGPFGKAGYPARGFLVEAIAAGFPKAWDVEKSYGWLEGSAATYLTVGPKGRATLALRTGGKRMLGDRYPFFSAASVGGGGFFSGSDEVRGLWPNRFIGDSSAYFSGELRLYLSRFFVALPGEWGLFGFGDVGRVWLDGETSDVWHSSWGGGIWIGLLSRSNAIALTVAQSEERTAFYVRAGFSF
jgi:hypothetical protein